MNVMTRKIKRISLCIAVAALIAGGLHAAEKGGKSKAPDIKLVDPAPVASAPAPAPEKPKIDPNTVIMKINGEDVKEAQLDEIMKEMLAQVMAQFGGAMSASSLPPEFQENLRTQAMKQLKDQVILDQAIKNLKYTPTDADIKNEWDLMDTRLKVMKGDDASFKAQIAEAGKQDPTITEEFVNKQLKKQLLAIKVVEQETKATVDPTPAEIKSIFEKDPQKWGKLHASHILIMSKPAEGTAVRVDKEALQKAQDALKEAKAGKDFAELAKKYSDDKGNADKGGDLGPFYFETMVPSFSEAAFKLKKGEISDLVQSPYGYHIIKALDYQPVKLDDPKSKISVSNRIVLAERGNKMPKLYPMAMMSLQNKAKVEDLSPKTAPAAPAPAAPAPAKEAPKKK
jgi:parvulin-like peptidyl-prolyl isomerase